MLETLLFVLILALVLFVIYYAVSQFVQGRPLQIIGLILAVILLILSLQRLGVFNDLDL